MPVPEDQALPDDVTREAVDQAIREADHTGVGGAALTPWLLARVAAITDGASVKANIALIVNNATVAGELAGARGRGGERRASAAGRDTRQNRRVVAACPARRLDARSRSPTHATPRPTRRVQALRRARHSRR